MGCALHERAGEGSPATAGSGELTARELAPRGFKHTWGLPVRPPEELRDLLDNHDQVEVRRCGACGLTAAWSPTWTRHVPTLRAVLGRNGWARGKRLGPCPGYPEAVARALDRVGVVTPRR